MADAGRGGADGSAPRSPSRWRRRSPKTGSWAVGDADDEAALALDAGQFRESLPWGWVVTGGREVLAPQYAPLAGAVVVDDAGAVRVVSPDKVASERARGDAREAFQSYPMLLENGVVPAPLSTPDGA